jgi:hypothetical protein
MWALPAAVTLDMVLTVLISQCVFCPVGVWACSKVQVGYCDKL